MTDIDFPEILQRIESFHELFGDAHLYLAYHAAFPIALTPHLTYCLWANFQTDREGKDLKIPWIAVADVLLSSLCVEVGHELYEMEKNTRNQLLDQLINNPRFDRQRIKKLSDFLSAYVRRQLNSPKASVRDFAIAQHWTALAYLNPEASAREFALKLTQLSLEERTEWIRMASLAETLATPLMEANFEPLLVYLQGMRHLIRNQKQQAKTTFDSLSTNNNRIVVSGVTLSIPEWHESVWNINPDSVTVPPLQPFEFGIATPTRQARSVRWFSKWTIDRSSSQEELFYEPLANERLEMVHIPQGEFLMGSSKKEGDYREHPQHRVKISSFFMSRFPITQSQWRAIALSSKVRIDLNPDPSRFKGANLPVEQVTWFEAIEFCERLQWQTGRPYRLPSEAEWEYACRAGTATPFYFGKTISPKLATYDGSQKYHSGPKGKSSRQTTEVGSLRAANAFGLEEMHGNVWEWCADHWYDDYNEHIDVIVNGTARITDNRDTYRVIRGGSWIDVPIMCRSAYRNYSSPNQTVRTIGFRIVVSFYDSKS